MPKDDGKDTKAELALFADLLDDAAKAKGGQGEWSIVPSTR